MSLYYPPSSIFTSSLYECRSRYFHCDWCWFCGIPKQRPTRRLFLSRPFTSVTAFLPFFPQLPLSPPPCWLFSRHWPCSSCSDLRHEAVTIWYLTSSCAYEAGLKPPRGLSGPLLVTHWGLFGCEHVYALMDVIHPPRALLSGASVKPKPAFMLVDFTWLSCPDARPFETGRPRNFMLASVSEAGICWKFTFYWSGSPLTAKVS